MKSRFRFLFLALSLASVAALAAPGGWITTWSRSSSVPYPDPAQLTNNRLVFSNQTLREIVHVSVGGDMVRVRLSNVHGTSAVQIGSAHIAQRTTASGIDPTSDHLLTVSGRSEFLIPPNTILLSDPVPLDVAPQSDLAVSLFFPNPTNGAGIHYLGLQTNYLGAGDQTAAATLQTPTSVSWWAFLTAVDVSSSDPASATIVTFGDSITDGAHSPSDTNQRWPDLLGARLLTAGIGNLGIANSGISGNRMLHDAKLIITAGTSGLERFGRDVLEQPGVKYVIILLGINDIGQPGTASADVADEVTSDDLLAGLQQMAQRGRQMGIKVYGCTLTPFTPTTLVNFFSPEKEVKRKAVNEWIRTSAAFDAVIDFDMIVRDPDHPDQMLPAYDSGDHLHPGNAGYHAMADGIDLNLFQQMVDTPVLPDVGRRAR
jgi:lysophospholipase L1-like esterase